MNAPTSWLLMFITVLMYGIANITQKIAVRYMSPVMVEVVSAYVYSVIGPMLFLYLKASNLPTVWDSRGVAWTILTSIIGAIGALSFLFALKTTPVHIVTGITATYPFVTFIACMFVLNEHITLYKVLGMLLVLCGTAMLAM